MAFSEKQLVTINDEAPTQYNIKVFNASSLKIYFGSNVDDNVQNILIDDNNMYLNALNQLNILLKDVVSIKDNLKDRYNRINEIVKKLGASKLNKGNKLSSKSPLSQTISTIEIAKTNSVYKEIETMEDGKFEWLITGYDKYLVNEKCPFCEKNVSKLRINKLTKFKNYSTKNLSTIQTQSNNYKLISGSFIGNTLFSLKEFEKKLINMSIACTEYEKMVVDIDKCYRDSSNENLINKFEYSKEFYMVFPELKSPIQFLNTHISTLKSEFRKAKNKTANILKYKTQMINRILTKFSIPYEVSAKYYRDRVIDYKLIHKKDNEKNDDKDRLSDGEKNIVSLIMFILQAQKESTDLIVFDDPVSSYDEYRRKQVIDLIVDKLKGKTILILSHDQVFAKYAVMNKSKSIIGNIDYLENFENKVKFTRIEESDFEVYSDSVLNRINELADDSYYIKIVNLRTLLEGRRGIMYSYLSAILHAKPVEEIKKLLLDEKITEKEVLELINDKFNVLLPEVSNEYYKNIDTTNLSIFEKGLILREYLAYHKNINNKVKKELDSYIHLNSRLHLCLNPYSFPFCSQYVYDTINTHITGIINIRD